MLAHGWVFTRLSKLTFHQCFSDEYTKRNKKRWWICVSHLYMNHFQETWNAFAFSIIVNIEMQLKSSYVEDKDPSVLHIQLTGIDLGAYAANESRRYIITTSLIGWAHNETDSCDTMDADNQGLFSLSGRTSYRKISWCFEAARFGLVFSNRYEIWQARRQQCCRGACRISER